MRKEQRTLIVFALLLLLSVNRFALLPLAQAEEAMHAVLSGESKVQAGQLFNLTFGLRGISQNIFAQELTLTYDSELLDFIGAESLKEGFSIIGQSETPGRTRIIAVSQGVDHAVNRDSDLLTLRWHSKQLVNPEVVVVSITNLVVSNGEGVEMKVGSVSYPINIIQSLSGDLNGDNRVTIGDLGIAVAAYGKTSAHPDWVQYQLADINHDGKVDIEDLAFVARAILNIGPDIPNKPVWSAAKQLNVTDVTYTGLTLTWSGATDPASVTGYKVYQDGRELATVTSNVYQVSGLISNKLYTFKVEAGHISNLWSTDGPVVTVTTPVLTVDKTGLLASIAMADLKHNTAVEGTSMGQYPSGSKFILQAVIVRTKQVADDSRADEQQVQEAKIELDAALQTFIASVNRSVEGDINGDNRVSVGDLAIVVKAYGRILTDPEWAEYVRADVNQDDQVDIEDLTFIAKLILN